MRDRGLLEMPAPRVLEPPGELEDCHVLGYSGSGPYRASLFSSWMIARAPDSYDG